MAFLRSASSTKSRNMPLVVLSLLFILAFVAIGLDANPERVTMAEDLVGRGGGFEGPDFGCKAST